jgi:hypothetical protein
VAADPDACQAAELVEQAASADRRSRCSLQPLNGNVRRSARLGELMEGRRREVHEAMVGKADSAVRHGFIAQFRGEFVALEVAIAEAYERWSQLEEEFAKDRDSATVVGMAFLVVARLVMSANLLSLGQPTLSGAAFRQALEALAAAFVLADPLSPHRAAVWEGRFSVNKAVQMLFKQSVTDTRLNRQGIEVLTKSREFYDKLSHPTALSMADVISFDGQGGHHLGAWLDHEKGLFYEQELASRTGFARIIPNAIEGIERRMCEWPQFARGV